MTTVIMVIIAFLISVAAMSVALFVFGALEREKRRNRVLQSFVAGLVRSISDYHSQTDAISPENVPEKNTQLPIPYKKVLEDIEYEFCKDFWLEPYQQWLNRDRSLFEDKRYYGDGFNWIYWDFFDGLFRQWHSGELLCDRDKALLDQSVKVSEQNLHEIEGEIGMFRDLMAGKIGAAKQLEGDVDSKLLIMFQHIKPELRERLKAELRKRQNEEQ